MANTFKSDVKANVVTDALSASTTVLVTAGGSSTLVLLSILLTNTSASSVQVDVFLVTSGDDVHLIKNAPVPAGSALEIISGSKIIMQANDVLRIRAATASAIDATVSYLDQT